MNLINKPSLIIVAGPNGAGKSTTSKKLLKEYGIEAFDFDKAFYDNWNRFSYDPLGEEGVKNITLEQFENHLSLALKKKGNVAFETNFHDPKILNYVDAFKLKGFQVDLIFMGLASIQLAKERVNQRVANGGHFVPENTIEERYNKGLELLDSEFEKFDFVQIHESLPDYTSRLCAILKKSDVLLINKFPFAQNLPKINSLLLKKWKNKGFNL